MKGLPNYSVVKKGDKFYLYDAGRGVFLQEPRNFLYSYLMYNREFSTYEEALEVADQESYEIAP